MLKGSVANLGTRVIFNVSPFPLKIRQPYFTKNGAFGEPLGSKFIAKTFYFAKFWDLRPGSYFIIVHKKSKLMYINWFWIHLFCYVFFFCHRVKNWTAPQKLHFSLNKVALILSGSGLKFKITLVLRFATPLL